MNTQKENPADAEQEFTGTSVPLPWQMSWRVDTLKVSIKDALDRVLDLYWLAKEIERSIDLFPSSDELQDIFDKVQPLLAEGQKKKITRLIDGLRKLEDL